MRIVNASVPLPENTGYAQAKEAKAVREIISDVRKNGDSAVRKYAQKFDKAGIQPFEVSRKEIKDAYRQVDRQTVSALRKAAGNIRAFAKMQLGGMKGFSMKSKGILLGQKIVPLKRVGCYVPGGRYPLPSTALMCVIPAKVAGVREVIVCSPRIKPATIVAADIAGADRVLKVGGVQAIAAMAYGTKTIPKVDKIVGPGNRFVTIAKKEVYGEVGIDFLAGPSEVLIIADRTGDAGMIAADLLAQAEHDPEAKANLITNSRELARKVNAEIARQVERLSTRKTAEAALKNGRIIIAKSLGEAAELSNAMAPEHLELQVKRPGKLAGRLTNYGSLFIGKWSAEVFGDYCSGTNHTLPTGRAARYRGGLSPMDFVKALTWQRITRKGVREMAKTATRLAEAEGLDAHMKAAQRRAG